MNHKIITGLASFGMSGKVFHAPLITSHPGFQLSSIVERSKSEAHKIYPEIKTLRSFDELLLDTAIELVIINTPDNTHFTLTKQALEAGKHVIVEKPFTQTSEEGKELIALAKKKNKMLSVFQNRRWDGDFLTLQKIISEGKLGRIVEFNAHFDRFRNYIQPDTWKENASTGTGTLYNLGSHLIDQALVLFGMPKAVFADIRTLRTNGKVDDFFELILYYNNIRVSLNASYLVKEAGPRYFLHGTNGSYVKYGLDPQEDALKYGILPNSDNWGEEKEENWGILHIEDNNKTLRNKYETLPGNYPAFYENIYNVLTRNAELAVKAEEGLQVIRVIEAAWESNRKRKLIDIE